MQSWVRASVTEQRQFEAILGFLQYSPHLIKFVFNSKVPRLRLSPEKLLKEARGLCSGDRVLVKLAIELWCCEGDIRVHELFDAEPEVFRQILKSFSLLAPRPSPFSLMLKKSYGGPA
jgi:hypothetical protein